MTHVGINLVFLVPGQTGGMEVFARELLPELVSQAPGGMRLTAFVNRHAGPGPWDELMPVVTVPVGGGPAHRVVGEQVLLPRLARREGVHLMHSLANTGPLWGRFRRVVTVHDLIYRHIPQAHRRALDLGVRLLVPAAVRTADRLIAVSESTRQDLIRYLHAAPEMIDVAHPGVRLDQHQRGLPEDEVRVRFDLGARKVLLSLSAKRPHKNLVALIDALASLEVTERPVLVAPGYPTWHEAELRSRAQAMGVAEDVRLLGWLRPDEIEGLWAVADALVFPSLYEGFGLPVLEALARGVPVGCSNVSSLPEVANGAALMFDPHDQRAIVETIRRLLHDQAERSRLRVLGPARARLFTWESTAAQTLETYGRTLASS